MILKDDKLQILVDEKINNSKTCKTLDKQSNLGIPVTKLAMVQVTATELWLVLSCLQDWTDAD